MKKKRLKIGLLIIGSGLLILGGVLLSVAQRTSAGSIWKEIDKDAPSVDIRKGFADLVERVKPAVINIYTTQKIKMRRRDFGSPFFWDEDPFENFLKRFFNMPDTREFKRMSLGSGFIINSKKKLALTNYHVVARADEIMIKLGDSENDEYKAEIVGSDPEVDVALIKILDMEDVPKEVPLGDSDNLRVGDWVIAVGNPFGYSRTVTAGIVSAKGRILGDDRYDIYIQTDAPINFGNSGGPLFNIKGEVVGINTAINPNAQNIGFAIPVNVVKELLPDLVKGKKVARGWLGVNIQNMNKALARSFGLKKAKGVLVTQVIPDTPAEKYGLEDGDIILKYDGKVVKNVEHLRRMVGLTRPGKMVEIVVFRNGHKKTLHVKIASREGEIEEERISKGHNNHAKNVPLGLKVKELNKELRERLEIPDKVSGLVVIHIDKRSIFARTMLEKGDVIVSVNRRPVRSINEFRRLMKRAKKEGNVLLKVYRKGGYYYIAVELK